MYTYISGTWVPGSGRGNQYPPGGEERRPVRVWRGSRIMSDVLLILGGRFGGPKQVKMNIKGDQNVTSLRGPSGNGSGTIFSYF